MSHLSEATRRSIPTLFPASEVTHSTRAVRSGLLVPVIRGVYAPAEDWSELAPWERYSARVRASALRHPETVYVLESAASLHGLPVFGDPGTVHGIGDDSARSRSSGGISMHTTTDEREVAVVDGMLVAGVIDTVVDIARSRHHAIGLAVADAALRADDTLRAEHFAAVNESRSSSRGRRHARWVLQRATALAESPLESVDRAVIEWLGFPDPELQVWRGRDRVDKWWPDEKVAGEGDGDLKYVDADAGRDALRERHARDARLFAHGAAATPHWGWSDVLAADPLYAILTTAGLRSRRTRDTVELHGLRRALKRPER